MESLPEFLRRQRDAALTIVTIVGSMQESQRLLTAEILRAAGVARQMPGGRAARAREAARQTRPALRSFGEAIRTGSLNLIEAIAQMSENWAAHQGFWDDLTPEDLAVVTNATTSWRDLQQAVNRAANGAAGFRASLERFAQTGGDPNEVAQPALQAQDRALEALKELDQLAGEYLEILRETERRLRE